VQNNSENIDLKSVVNRQKKDKTGEVYQDRVLSKVVDLYSQFCSLFALTKHAISTSTHHLDN
jgi:hypothetical protein